MENKKYTYIAPSGYISTFDESGILNKVFKINMKEFKKLINGKR